MKSTSNLVRNRFFALAAIVAIPCLAHAQQPWQHLQMPTSALVAKRWKNPPAAYGPEPYYGWNGDMTEAVINRDLDTMKALGFRAVTAQAGKGMSYPYLSAGYFKLFREFVEAAKKHGMKVWIVDDAGYPSGFSGGKFTQLKPDLRMQALELAQKVPVSGGGTVAKNLPPNTVAVLAVNSEGAQQTVPVRNGAIHWTAPPGQWTLLVVEHQFRTSPTRSATNPKGGKNADQSLEDYMNPAATKQYLAWTHEQYKRYMGGEFGKTIMGFRGDEPDYSIRGIPWTNAFFERFEQIKGYDVRPYVASFFAPKMTDEEKRIKADYWDVFSRMFSAGFFQVQGQWCAENHLEYQVHLNHEEREMELAHSEGGFFRDMRYVQVPGIDAIWHQIWTDTISDFPRLASSAAHVYGKPRAFTESFAAYRPRPNVEQARYILNEQFVRGINLVEIMFFPATSAGPRPLRSFMAEPGFPELMHYVQRMSYLMSMGRPAASVALYLPTSSFWLDDAAANQDFVSTERLLSEHQIDFDIVDDDALAKDLVLGKGTFRTLSGNRYRTVILPGENLLSQAALNRLRAFAGTGGHVLFLGHLPSLIAGRTIRDARPVTPVDFSWASVEVSAQLSPTPTPGLRAPAASPPPQMVPAAILQALNRAIPRRDLTLDAPDTALRYVKRRLNDASVYLFFNEGGQPLRRTVTLTSKGTNTEVWDPQTGELHALASTRGKGFLTIELTLKPYATRVIVVR
ncbi:MAG: glycosyl hydrolase [Bryobacteraceae bacterium]